MDSTLFTRCFRCMEDMGSDSLCPHCGYDNSHGNPQPYALPAGTILRGKYVLGLPLGQGGFGITYIGWEVAAGRKVAIKEYFPTGQVSRSQEKGRTELIWYSTEQANFAQHDGMDAFLREARKMEKVSKIPQVVSILEVFEENATAYIVMDYIQGENLKDRIQRTGPMSWEEAEKIFLPVAKAMAQVHKAGLIHRDLSPDNLIIQPDGTVRILDLGAAKDLSINTGVSSMQVAKNGFSPPEQYTQQGGSGTWTDVYALAATMYFAVTGKLPPSAMDRLTEDALQWDNPQIAALPENAAIAMQKAMVLFRNNRTQTMEAFIEGLGGRQEPAKNTVQGSGMLQADKEPQEEAIPAKLAVRKKASKMRIPKWCVATLILAIALAVWGMGSEGMLSEIGLGGGTRTSTSYSSDGGYTVTESDMWGVVSEVKYNKDNRVTSRKDYTMTGYTITIYFTDGSYSVREYDKNGTRRSIKTYNASGKLTHSEGYDANG